MDDGLFPVIAAHCFFACPAVASGTDPQGVHAAMETHYETAHAAALARLLPAEELTR